MELTGLKRIQNTGELSGKYKEKAEQLPGFEGGSIPASVAWSNTPNYMRQAGVSSNPQITNTLPRVGQYDFSGAKAGVQDMMKQQPNVPKQSTYANSQGPSQADSSAAGIHPGFAIGAWLGGGALEGANEILASDPERLIGEAGTSTAQIGGISFQRQNVVDAGQMMQDYNNSKDLDWLTNPARAITKLFGKGQYRRNVQLAATKSANIAGAQTNSALTTAMRLNNAKLNGDSSAQYLYGAKDGKLPCFAPGKQPAVDPNTGLTKSNYLLYTDNGPAVGKANAMGQPGELMVDTKTGSTQEIAPDLPRFSGDIQPIYADRDTAILTDNWIDPVTHKTYAQAAKDGDDTVQNLIDRMAQYVKPSKQTKYAKNGKLPKFAEGGWGNAVIAGIGALQGLDQYLTALRNKPYKPNTYVDNPYELDALTTLAGLRVNPYPILGQLRNAETRTNRAIDMSGGLSVAQRSLGRLSALNTTQNNIANTLSAIQQQNNQYKANYAQAAINAGQAARQARMQANQWDLDYYSKAHAAQLGGLQMGARNILGALQGWQQNDFKRRQFNDTMALYRDDQKRNWAELDMLSRQNNLFNTKDDYLSYGKKMGWV